MGPGRKKSKVFCLLCDANAEGGDCGGGGCVGGADGENSGGGGVDGVDGRGCDACEWRRFTEANGKSFFSVAVFVGSVNLESISYLAPVADD